MINWLQIGLGFAIGVPIGLILGYLAGKKASKIEVLRTVVIIVTLSLWWYRVILQASQPALQISTYESLVASIIILTVVNPAQSILDWILTFFTNRTISTNMINRDGK